MSSMHGAVAPSLVIEAHLFAGEHIEDAPRTNLYLYYTFDT